MFELEGMKLRPLVRTFSVSNGTLTLPIIKIVLLSVVILMFELLGSLWSMFGCYCLVVVLIDSWLLCLLCVWLW